MGFGPPARPAKPASPAAAFSHTHGFLCVIYIYIYDPGPRARGPLPPMVVDPSPPMVYPPPWDGRGGGHGEGGLNEGRCGGLDEQMSRKAEEQKSRGAEKLVGVFQFEDRSFVAFVCFSEGSTLDSLAPAQSKRSHAFSRQQHRTMCGFPWNFKKSPSAFGFTVV